MTLPQNRLTALVLSGGGAHGAYEVGVLKALMSGASWTTGNVPLSPDVITGTSIGAFNGAVLIDRLTREASGAAVRSLEDVWVNLVPRDGDSGHNHVYRFRGNPAELFSLQGLPRQPLRALASLGQDALFFAQDWFQRGIGFFSSASAGLAERFLELIDLSTVISREPTERLLRKTILLENVRRSPRLLFVAVTNWRTGQLGLFRNEDMTEEVGFDAVLASSALPGIFPPVQVRGDTYVDGGLALNTPLGPAFLIADPGPDTAHVIYLDPKIEDIPLGLQRSTVSTMDRLITIILSRSIDADMRIASRVNRGLQLMEQASRKEAVTAGDGAGLVGSLSYLVDGIGGRLPDSPKTIHRYRPSRYLGGTMSLLNFSRERIIQLIELGFNDVMQHDCHASACVLPDGPVIEAVKGPAAPANGDVEEPGWAGNFISPGR